MSKLRANIKKWGFLTIERVNGRINGYFRGKFLPMMELFAYRRKFLPIKVK
jgi:hypothetical protein